MAQVYFGVKKTEKFYFDKEEVQFVEYKKLPEGEKGRFEDSLNSKVQMNQETKMLQIDSKTGAERKALVLASVVNFSILFGENGEERKGDAEAFKPIYDEMDADKAAELYDAILIFNGYKKKEEGK